MHVVQLQAMPWSPRIGEEDDNGVQANDNIAVVFLASDAPAVGPRNCTQLT